MKVISIRAYRHTHYRKPREPGGLVSDVPGRKQETEEERAERIWQNILAEMRRIRKEEKGEKKDV